MPAEDAATSHWWNKPGTHRAARNIAAAVPILLVNATAFIGQFAWTRDHVPWIAPGQVLFSVAIESVAIYLAWHAHQAQLANDSATRLKLAAYSFALVIGAMNYSHYADHWRPNALAVALGLMSALSPWLWGVHSRRASRDQLLAQGLVEPHAVRLGATRWTWHPFRAFIVMRRATWVGEASPQRAIAPFEDRWDALAPAEPARAILPGVPVAQDPVPALAVPAVPAPAVPAASAPPEPEVVHAGTAPRAGEGAPEAPAVPDATTMDEQPEVHLDATARMGSGNSKRPPEEIVAAARKALAETPVDKLPSVRWIARELLGDPEQRRLAHTLKEERITDEAREAFESLNPAGPPAPAANRQARPDRPQHIASPARNLPGGGDMR